ncbi:MAG: single-stranded DNA-binding protein [Treponema sp.]|nr:single-stranded DNA-binding protein [Candidatus Treponema scatequi]
MKFQNSVSIDGFIGAKPELKQSVKGTNYVCFTLYWNEERYNKESDSWTKISHKFKIQAWKKLAERVSNFEKGTAINVVGALRYSKYGDPGEEKERTYILANEIREIVLKAKRDEGLDASFDNPKNYQNGLPSDAPISSDMPISADFPEDIPF